MPAQAVAAPAAPVANAIGYEIDMALMPEAAPAPIPPAAAPAEGTPAAQPLFVRIRVPLDAIESTPGQRDWSVLDALVQPHAAAGYGVILFAQGGSAPLPADEATWGAFLRELATRYAATVDLYQLEAIGPGAPARDAAYALKLASVTIRSADPGAQVALGDLDLDTEGTLGWIESLYAEGVAPYVDVLAARGEAVDAPLKAIMQLQDPAARIWRADRRVAVGIAAGGFLLRDYLESLRREAALTIFTLEFAPEGLPRLEGVLRRIRDLFTPGLTPLVESGRGTRITTAMGEEVRAASLRLYDPDAKRVLLAYDAGDQAVRGTQSVMVLDSVDVADPLLRDVAAGEQAAVAGWQKDTAAGVTRLALPLADYPLVLEYRRFTSPLYGQEERLEITEGRLPSVEEILAAHQAFQAAQDTLLVNLRAQARIDYHFKISASGSIDATILSAFFLDPNVGAEWEYQEFFVNGVKWRSDRIPEFPLPQPEQVLSLPLDLALDERYAYRLKGEEMLDPYDCWVVSFEPRAPGGTLYAGTVWIDKASHAKVQISSVQTGLASPVLSNEEKDSYRPVRGPDGLDRWLLARIEGQQIFTLAGANLVLIREIQFTDHVVNDQDFARLRAAAYAGSHQMLRETPAGPRYLENTPDGGRVVKPDLDPDNLFLVGGVFYTPSLDFPIPLAGIDYFNRNLGKRNLQANLFAAGPLVFGNLTDPALFGTPLVGSVDVGLMGFSFTDAPIVDDEEVEEESVDRTAQSLTLSLGFPFADFWKVEASFLSEYQVFAHDEDTASGFTIPQDTMVNALAARGEFNRDAWSVTGTIAFHERNDWQPWGDPLSPGFVPFDPDTRSYTRYAGSVTKEFYLPYNQKIRAAATMMGGASLDRFSAYQFSFFGNRLRGFGGAGFSFRQGAQAHAAYDFNLANLIRFQAAVDYARVKAIDEPGSVYDRFCGVGLSGQSIVGPNLIVRLDWGIALGSSVDEFRGDQEILLALLKLFR